MADRTTRAIAYIRTATHTTTARENSTSMQARRIERYCSEHDIALIGSVVEYEVSGTGIDRAGLLSVFSTLIGGRADVLIGTNVSQLTRCAVTFAQLADTCFGDGQHGLISLDESLDTRTANGRFVLGLLSAIARWESEVLYHA